MPAASLLRLGLASAVLLAVSTTSPSALTVEEGRARARAAAEAAAKAKAAQPVAPARVEPARDPLDPTAPWQARFDAMDTDHDGRLTREEARAHGDRQFDAMDTDKDGKASPAEWAVFHRPRSKVPLAAAQIEKLAGEASAAFAAADRNHDGSLTREEWRAAIDAHLTRADVNRRGSIFDWEYRRFAW